MFENIIAPNAMLNATLDQGHTICNLLARAGFPNPKLYANQIFSGPQNAHMVPELPSPNDTAPYVDTSTSLKDLNVPSNLAIYLQVRVDNKPDYFCVGMIIREMLLYGAGIKDTLQ